MSAPLRLELPVPPSANRWWRTFRGRMVMSPEARFYQRQVVYLALNQLRHLKPHGEKLLPIFAKSTTLVVTVRWFREARRGDLDKRLGVLLDALQGTVYQNDNQIVELHAFRVDGDGRPRVEVEVAPR